MSPRCPFCHDAVSASVGSDARPSLPRRLADPTAVAGCSTCATPHHAACLAQHGGCTVLGCASGPVRGRRAPRLAPARRRTRRALAATLLAIGLAAAGAREAVASTREAAAAAVRADDARRAAIERELAEVSASRLVGELTQLQCEYREANPRPVPSRYCPPRVRHDARFITGLDELLGTVDDEARRRELERRVERARPWYRFDVVGGPGRYVIVARFTPPTDVAGPSFHAARRGAVHATTRWPVIGRDRDGDPVVSDGDRPWPLPPEPTHRAGPPAVFERIEFLEGQRQVDRALAFCEEQALTYPQDLVLRARAEELRGRARRDGTPSAWARRPLGTSVTLRETSGSRGVVLSVTDVVQALQGMAADEVVLEVTRRFRHRGTGEPQVWKLEVRRSATGPLFDPSRRGERATVTVPAGTFSCWHATIVREMGLSDAVVEVWFDDDLPVPLREVHTWGDHVSTTELVELPTTRKPSPRGERVGPKDRVS